MALSLRSRGAFERTPSGTAFMRGVNTSAFIAGAPSARTTAAMCRRARIVADNDVNGFGQTSAQVMGLDANDALTRGLELNP